MSVTLHQASCGLPIGMQFMGQFEDEAPPLRSLYQSAFFEAAFFAVFRKFMSRAALV